jgi:FeS assembly SUF system regulator
MLKISKLADYGSRILFLLATYPDKRYSASQVAQETHIATPTVSKVLKLLHEAALVNSERGATGGYQLARLPTQITVADLIAAIDGQLAITECSKGDNICEHHNTCELRNHWQLINQVVLKVLQNLTLADLCWPQMQTLLKKFHIEK